MHEEALRIFNLGLKDTLDCAWAEQTPIIRHIVIECVGVAKRNLDDDKLLAKMGVLCEGLDLHVVNTFSHAFSPQGVSIVMVLEESHVAIHSWPEKGYCHIDLVTCTKHEQDLFALAKEVSGAFSARSVRILNLKY